MEWQELIGKTTQYDNDNQFVKNISNNLTTFKNAGENKL